MSRAQELFDRIVAGGEAAIEEFIATRSSEELFLEFKRSHDDGGGPRLNQRDREHLAKAISGFGNSEGGVIVWGIDCSMTPEDGDVARTKFPVQNAPRFKSWLEGVVSSCTVPPHSGVIHHAIPSDGANNGFVLTLIPAGHAAPYQAIYAKRYFIRAGSDFVPTPHEVLAGLFGRRPQPHVFHMYAVPQASFEGRALATSLGIKVANDGPGIAENLFLNVTLLSLPGELCELRFDPTDQNWNGYFVHQVQVNMISNVGVRLAPEAQHQPLQIHLKLTPPFTRDLLIKGMAGAGNSPPYRFELHNTPDRLTDLYERHVATSHNRGTDITTMQQLTADIFGIRSES